MENEIENDNNEIERINKAIKCFLMGTEDLDILYEMENLIIDYEISNEKEARENEKF